MALQVLMALSTCATCQWLVHKYIELMLVYIVVSLQSAAFNIQRTSLVFM